MIVGPPEGVKAAEGRALGDSGAVTGPKPGGVAEPVYALDSKSSGLAPCGFESHRPHPLPSHPDPP